MYEVKKLYRKANKKALNYGGNKGGDFCRSRHTKAMKAFEGTHLSMQGHKERGLDYTPLFKFLLSKVGQCWNDVFSEAVARLDKKDPIFWLVDLHPADDDNGIVCMGEASCYSKLTVTEDGILVRLRPGLSIGDMQVYCTCCTHSFNGEVYTKHEA